MNIQEWIEQIVAQCGLSGFWRQAFGEVEYNFHIPKWVDKIPMGVDNLEESHWILSRGSWDVTFMDEYVEPGQEGPDRFDASKLGDELLIQYQSYRAKRLKADKLLKEKLKQNGYIQNQHLPSQWLSKWSQEHRDENGFEITSALLKRRG